MKFKYLTGIFISITFITSCSYAPFVILPEYQDVKIKNKELLIVDIDSSLSTVDLSILGNKNLQIEYLSIFQKSFENGISEASSFLRISTNTLNEPEIINPQEVTLPTGEKIILFFPETDKIITDKDGHIPDYLLIISKLELTSAWVDEPFGPYKGYRQQLYYTIWDNFRNKPVCYGESVEASQSFSWQFDSIITRYFIRQNARLIIANSPFKR